MEELLQVPVESVSRWTEPLREVSSNIYIMDSDTMEALGLRHLADVLHLLPSIEYGQPRSWLQGGIRGFSDNWSKVKFLLDGEDFNLLYTGEAFIGHQFPVALIERVEVIPGPASVLYGSEAYSGILNIVSKKSARFSTGAMIHSGSRHFFAESVFLQLASNKHAWQWSFSAFGLKQEDGDFSDFVSTSEFSEPFQELRQSLLESGSYPYRDDNRAQAYQFHSQRQFGRAHQLNLKVDFRYDRDGGGQESPEISFRDFVTKRRQSKVSIALLSEFQSGISSKLQFRFRNDDEINRFNFRSPVDGGVSPLYRFDIEDSREIAAFWDLVYLLPKKKITVQGGLGVYFRDLSLPIFELDDFNELDPYTEQNNWHAYFQFKKRLGNQFSVSLGGRKDHHDQYRSPTVIRGSLLYDYSSQFITKLLFGQSFRAPTLFELELNEKLTPSEMTSIEWVGIFLPSSTWIFQLSVFQNQADKLIVNRQITDGMSPDLFRALNAGKLDVLGLETQITHNYSRGTMTGWMSLTDSSEGLDIAKQKAGVWLTYSPLSPWQFSGSAKYTSAIVTEYNTADFQTENHTVPSYFRVDTSASWSFTPSWKAQLQCQNVFNRKQYFANVRGSDPKQFLDLGRSVNLFVTFRKY